MAMKGFIIDAPNALIVSGNDVYQCVTASSGQIQLQGSSTEVKGGWSIWDLISIPTSTQITVTLTDAQFDGDAIKVGFSAEESAASSTNLVDEYHFGETYTIDSSAHTIVIAGTVKSGSMKIAGLEETTEETVADGKFKVSSSQGNTTVTFNASKTGDVSPVYIISNQSSDTIIYDIKNDAVPKKGLVILKFPVYTSESDDASIAGYAQITVYSAAIIQNMTIGGSYKTASTFELQFKGLDSKRADKKVFSVAFIPAS